MKSNINMRRCLSYCCIIKKKMEQDRMGYIWGIFVAFFVVYVLFNNWEKLLLRIDGDIAGGFFYMRKIWETGNPFTPEFAHPTEILFLQEGPFPFLVSCFTRDLISASKLMVLLMGIWTIICLGYFFYQLKWSLSQWLLGMSIFLGLSPMSTWFYCLGQDNIAYGFIFSLSCITWGLLVEFHRKMYISKKKWSILCLIAFFGGINGLKMLMFVYIPCFMAEGFAFIGKRINGASISFKPFLCISKVIGVNMIGLLIHKFLIAPYMKYNSPWGLFLLSSDKIKDSLLRGITDFLSAFGVFFDIDRSVFSKEALMFLFYLSSLMIIIWGWRLLRRTQFLCEWEEVLMNCYIIAGGMLLVILSVTNMVSTPRYYLWSITIFFPIILVSLYRFFSVKKELYWLRCAYSLFLLFGILISASMLKNRYGVSPYYSRSSEVTTYLFEMQCKRVSGTYWNVQPIGLLSDGKIVPLIVEDSPRFRNWDWITDRTWYTNDDDSMFLILTDDEVKTKIEDKRFQHLLELVNSEKMINSTHIYSFSNNPLCFDRLKVGGDAKYNFLSLNFSNGAVLDNGQIVLKQGDIQYGPYVSLNKGRYEVQIRGNNLLEGVFDVFSSQQGNSFEIHDMQKGMTDVHYRIELQEDTHAVEFRCFNHSVQNISIRDITVISLDRKLAWE